MRPLNSPHVGFGFGTHVCIGASLVRMEVRAFLERLLPRFSRIELTGEPERVKLTIRNSWTRFPLVFRD